MSVRGIGLVAAGVLVTACGAPGGKPDAGADAGLGYYGGYGGGGGGGGSGGGGGGGGGDAGFTLSGTLLAPTGQSVLGCEVDACVLDSSGNCDPALTRVLNITASGASAPFQFTQLPALTYYVIAGKDVNGDNQVGVGDWLGGYFDANGDLKGLTQATAGLSLQLVVLPTPQATTPAELVGSWTWSNIYGGDSYIIRANATYDYVYLYETSATCIAFRKLTSSKSGALATQGDQITFSPTSGTTDTTSCSGTVTSKNASTQPVAFTWRVVTNGSAPPSLFLKDANGETEYHKQ